MCNSHTDKETEQYQPSGSPLSVLISNPWISLPVLGFYMNRIIHCLLFCVWILLLSICFLITLLSIIVLHSYYCISFCECITIYLSYCWWAFRYFSLLQIVQLGTFSYRSFSEQGYTFLLDVYMGHRVCSALRGPYQTVLNVALPFTPSSVWVFHLVHIFTGTWHFLFHFSHASGFMVVSHCNFYFSFSDN